MKHLFLSCLRHPGALLVFVVLLAAGCQKNDDLRPNVIPPATEFGRNAIGCLLNGQMWGVDAGNASSANSSVKAWYTPGAALDVEAKHEGGVYGDSQLQLHLDAPSLRPGTYDLDQGIRLKFEDYESEFGDEYAAGGTIGDGTVTITKVQPVAANGSSPAYTIVAGTFSFTAVSPITGASAHLTDGRFDVKAY